MNLPKYIKPKLFCSFSGGRTSGYMTYWIKNNLEEIFNIQYVFANTGQEHEKTLRFVNQCEECEKELKELVSEPREKV